MADDDSIAVPDWMADPSVTAGTGGVPRIAIPSSNGVTALVAAPPAATDFEQVPAPQGVNILDKLLGTNGVERYQLWPEKMIRSGFSLPHDVTTGAQPVTDPASGEISEGLIQRVQDLAGLIGSGSLPAAALSRDIGAAGMVGGKLTQPNRYLVPAWKLGDKITKGKPGQEHFDILPDEVTAEAPDDLDSLIEHVDGFPNLVRGFVNDKGHFLKDAKATEYALANDLVHPEHAEYLRQYPGIFTADMLRADSGDVGAPLSALEKGATGPFYSAVEHAVANAPQDKMSAQQWVGWLKNQPGVKQEELDWVGLPRNGGQITKQELLDHVAGHGPQIKEVEKRGNSVDLDWADEVARDSVNESDMEYRLGREPTEEEMHQEYERILDNVKNNPYDYGWEPDEGQSPDVHPTKYDQYQLPGGDNYRELLLTLPEKSVTNEDALKEAQKFSKHLGEDWDKVPPDAQERYIEAARQQLEGNGENKDTYRSSHWDEPNVLVHLRMNDRTIPLGDKEPLELRKDAEDWARDHVEATGENWDRLSPQLKDLWLARAVERVPKQDTLKSLHLEEVQSDWHQQGRKNGYRSNEPSKVEVTNNDDPRGAPFVVKVNGRPDKAFFTKSEAEEHAEWARTHIPGGEGRVPNAPFKTTWADLALKRAITKAAREGYDAISWTPGEQQAARYDLSKQVGEIQYNPDTKKLLVRGLPSSHRVEPPVLHEGTFEPNKLADVIGKEAADRLLNNPSDKDGTTHILEGEGLKVGGEGMKKFYDKMLVDKANAIAKKFGGKVEYKNIGNTVEYTKAPDGTWYPADEHGMRTDGPQYEILPFGNTPAAKQYPNAYDQQQMMVLDKDQNGVVAGPFKSGQEAEAWIASKGNKPLRVPVLRLTPKMKDAALRKGMPLFMHGLPFSFTPVDHDPFKEDKK